MPRRSARSGCWVLSPLLWRRAWTNHRPTRRGRLAHELREILVELSRAELAPGNLDLLEGIKL
jgi:hypothetical protein